MLSRSMPTAYLTARRLGCGPQTLEEQMFQSTYECGSWIAMAESIVQVADYVRIAPNVLATSHDGESYVAIGSTPPNTIAARIRDFWLLALKSRHVTSRHALRVADEVVLPALLSIKTCIF